jgi:hypothetical protein
VSDIGWRAEGIERARAAGGVDLDVYHRPGFTGGIAVRRAGEPVYVPGIPVDPDPRPDDDE